MTTPAVETIPTPPTLHHDVPKLCEHTDAIATPEDSKISSPDTPALCEHTDAKEPTEDSNISSSDADTKEPTEDSKISSSDVPVPDEPSDATEATVDPKLSSPDTPAPCEHSDAKEPAEDSKIPSSGIDAKEPAEEVKISCETQKDSSLATDEMATDSSPTSPPAESESNSATKETPKTTQDDKIYGLLTEDQLLEAMYLVSVYQGFWEKNRDPVISLRDVGHLLEEAAEIVIQLKTLKNSSTVIAANAHEYLWNLETLPPSDEFVRGLVHATLQLADGTYIDDLNAEAVDTLISNVVEANLAYKDTTQRSPQSLVLLKQQAEQISDQIKSNWAETTKSLDAALNGQSQLWTSSLVSELTQLQNSIDGIRRQIDCFEARKSFKEHDQPSLSSRCKREGQKPKQETTNPNPPTQEDEETKKGILKVENLHKKVASLDSEISNLSNTIDSDVKNVARLVLKPKESLAHIVEMKKKAAIYFDSLCKDLDSLDLISGEKLRALRKKEVVHVQELIDSVERIQSQILKLEEEVNTALEKEEKVEAEKRRESEEKALISKQQNEEIQRKRMQLQKRIQEAQAQKECKELSTLKTKPEPPRDIELHTEADIDLEASWRRMRLDIDLQSQERRDCYIITGNIPNMNKKDITVRLDNDKLIVGGFRGPTQGELDSMMRLLSSRRHTAFLTPKERAVALLRIGSGRFGTFRQTFQLPQDAIIQDIEAVYNHGILCITIPKRAQRSPPPRSHGIPWNFFEEPRNLYQDPRYTRAPSFGYPNPAFNMFW